MSSRVAPQREPRSGELCKCGRPATVVFITANYGEVAWCGSNDRPPLDSVEMEAFRHQLAKRLGRPVTAEDVLDALPT